MHRSSVASGLCTGRADPEGFTLYGFTNDAEGTPTCTDHCADTWPPLLLDSQELPEGLHPSVFSVVQGQLIME